MNYIVFMDCDCYRWPIALGNSIGPCGWCGVKPHTPAEEPPDGRAHPLSVA